MKDIASCKGVKGGSRDALKRQLRLFRREGGYWLLCLPGLLLIVVFSYFPMYGVLFSFSDYSIRLGLFGSEFVGLSYFREFITGPYFWRLIRNTVLLNLMNLLFSFPFPIIFALLLNEVRSKALKRTIQTITYMPHFISTVIVVGIMCTMLSPSSGIINKILVNLGVLEEPVHFMYRSLWFRPLYVVSEVWQHFGWNSIIYLAALTGVDEQLYEAAELDGANRWKKLVHITLPAIMPTIVTMLILNIGSLMNVGFEKVLLMQDPSTYSVSDVIQTYVYREGLLGSKMGYSSAVNLFNSVINIALVVSFNKISRKVSEVSLW